MFGKKHKYYITTSIPYTNAPPHIGFALEIIQADVLARYSRFLGKEVFFLTGTDEHGQKTLKAAQAAGKDPLEFSDEFSKKFNELTNVLNISNDDFIRTTDEKRHLPSVYKLWEKYKESGDIYKKKYKGFYCSGCEAFKTEKELANGNCTIHQRPVEEIEEENYFFKLSKYLPEIRKIIETGRIKIIPENKKNEILAMIDQGIEDVSFSRTKEKYWSWPVPNDNSQVFYVWQDALPNYISALGYAQGEKKFRKYWPADVHCIGKDIVKFHAIYWPAMLLSAKLDLPKTIFIHGFINVDGQKMSKSLGNVIDPFELSKKYGTDAVRYFLMREIPATEDGDFTYEKFENRYNADLASGLGNLVLRVVALAVKLDAKPNSIGKIFKKEISNTKIKISEAMIDFKFNEALKSIWDLIAFCDKHINETKPWEGKNESKNVIAELLSVLLETAKILSPFLPETSIKIEKIIKDKKTKSLFPRT